MNSKLLGRLEAIEQQRRSGPPVVVVPQPDEDDEAALDRVTNGRGTEGRDVIFIHGGLPE